MNTLVASLVIGSAVLHAAWNTMLKGRSGDPLVASTGLSITWAAVGLPLLLVVGPLAPSAWGPLGASIAIHLAYFGLLTRAYRGADLSLIYPIARGLPPVLVALGAWLVIGEQPSAVASLGIGCVGAGVVAIGLMRPQSATAARSTSARAIGMACVIAGLIAAYTLIDAIGVRHSGDVAGYLVWLTTLQGGLFAGGALVFGGRPLAAAVWRRKGTAIASGVLSAAGYAVALWAFAQAPLASVAALRETAVVFAAAFGAFVLREPLGSRRLAAAAVVALGAIVIRVGG